MVDTFSIVVAVVICGVLTLPVLYYSLRWQRSVHSGAPLPKGTFSWPIIGETLEISRDPLAFAISHEKRYGSIFKTSVFLRKSIVGTTSEFVKFVFANPDIFTVQYPKTVEFISPNAIFFGDGPRHLAIKKLFRRFIFPENLSSMIPALESIILQNLASWDEKGSVLGSDATEELDAETSSYLALGIKNIRSTPEGKLGVKNMLDMIAGIGALPINIPGTAHHKARQARDALRSFLRSIVKERASHADSDSDILRIMLEARDLAQGEEMAFFDEDKIVDEMVGAWFGAYKTTATTLAWAMKFLLDYPDVFKRVQAEQEEILKGKDLSVEGPRLTWEDMRRMVYAGKVFQEIQRKLSISFVVPRKAAQDVVYNGILIPKGWAVIPLIVYVHHDPANLEDPMTFNPDRFDAPPKLNTYLPFGLGAHRCPGEELTKLVFNILVHYLSTTYKYEREGPDQGMARNGFPTLVGGYPIKVSRRT